MVGTTRQFVIAIVLASLVGIIATICLATATAPTKATGQGNSGGNRTCHTRLRNYRGRECRTSEGIPPDRTEPGPSD